MHKIKYILPILMFLPLLVVGQLWTSDQGDGTYKNPILYADYSDPDVIKVKDDYFMVSSAFTTQPGIPILHSKDLVNWKIINHAYQRLPQQRFDKPQHGEGSWAPSIRYHDGKYYIYFCTPSEGLFVSISDDPWGQWDLTHMVDVEKWEDPSPFWDDDGNAYLVRGALYAGPCIIHKMSKDGKRILDNGTLVYKDLERQPVLEGFKFMPKRDGYYYISAPAGGVGEGWQTILRSKNIYGPYEDKIVLHTGDTEINGPHQGGFVEDKAGDTWFLHFQDKGVWGRIVHMQPVNWIDGWPIPGEDQDGDGIGEPVMSYKKPNVGQIYPIAIPQTSDEFTTPKLGLQWQWHSAPQNKWYQMRPQDDAIRLYTIAAPEEGGSLFFVGNQLLQKVMSPNFTATTKLSTHFKNNGERAGLVMMGNSYSTVYLEKTPEGNKLKIAKAPRVNRRWLDPETVLTKNIEADEIYLKINMTQDQTCTYSYSLDGHNFIKLDGVYKVFRGMWIGAKVGIYTSSANIVADESNYTDFDWFRVE